jgi:hypothetical protein
MGDVQCCEKPVIPTIVEPMPCELQRGHEGPCMVTTRVEQHSEAEIAAVLGSRMSIVLVVAWDLDEAMWLPELRDQAIAAMLAAARGIGYDRP